MAYPLLAPLLSGVLTAAVLAQPPDGGAVPPSPPSPPPSIEQFVAPDSSQSSPAVEAFETLALSGISARAFGTVWGFASVDTRFDSPPHVDQAENVAELHLRTSVGVDVKLSEHLRLMLEGRAQFRGVTQRDFERTKGYFEPWLGDAYVDVYSRWVDVRVGNQRIALGANAGLAAIDALNPRDLRDSFISGEADDGLLPVFAVTARAEIGKVAVTAAYAPFFEPHRYVVFGQDQALLQPAAEVNIPNQRVDPSIEDHIQDQLLETKRPVPFAGDVALRALSTGAWKVGLSWAWVNEKLPAVTVDPELSAFLKAEQTGRRIDPALTAELSNRLQAGEKLFVGEYHRQHIFAFELSHLLGPGQLDVDVSYSPRQTFFDAAFAPISKSAVSWVVGFSQATDSPLIWSVNYLGLFVPDVKAAEQLFLIEPTTAIGADRVAWFHLLAGYIAYPFFSKRLELSLRAAFEVVQKSFALAPKVAWKAVDGLEVYLAAEFQEGNPYSPFGYFDRNDQVLAGVRYVLF